MNSAERLNSLWICGDPEKHPELQKTPVSWFCADNGENPRMAVFRKTFELDKLPADALEALERVVSQTKVTANA